MMFAARTSPTPFRARSSSSVAVLISRSCVAAGFSAGLGLMGLVIGAGLVLPGTAGLTACAKQRVAKAAPAHRQIAMIVFLGFLIASPFWQGRADPAHPGKSARKTAGAC